MFKLDEIVIGYVCHVQLIPINFFLSTLVIHAVLEVYVCSLSQRVNFSTL